MFEIFKRVEINCPVIFTTPYDELAPEAFKVNSIDYLLKPLTLDSINRALKKSNTLNPWKEKYQEINKLIADLEDKSTHNTSFLLPGKGDKLIPLTQDKIAFIYVENGIANAVDLESRVYRFPYFLDHVIERLDPVAFFRTNRQFVISRAAIKDIYVIINGFPLILK